MSDLNSTSVKPASKEQSALLSFSALSSYTSLGRSRIYGLVASKKFPPQIKIGKSSRWVKTEIDTWVKDQIANRQACGGEA